MMLNEEQIQIEALSLPMRQRAELAERLLNSLESDATDEIESEWLAVSRRRLEEIRSGQATPVNGDAVMANARTRVGQ